MWRMLICRLSLHIFGVLICTVTSHNHKNIPLSYGDYLSQYHPHQVEKRNHHVREKKYVDNLKKFHELEQSLNEETNLHFYIRHNHFLDWFDEELSGLFHTIPHPTTTTADQESASTSDAQKVLEDIKDEIRRGRNMTRGDLRRSRSRSNSNSQSNKRRMNINSEYNEQINWASTLNPLGSNILTPIQNQGECGACWAFAAAEATAASLRINGYPQVTLSAQELLDCDSGFNSGCSGGNPAMAYLYIMEHGITTALSLPYQGYEQQCYRNDIALPDSDDPSTSTTTTTTSSLTSSSLISSSISSVSHSQNQKLQSSPSILISEKSLASASSSPTPVATISKFVILPSRNEFFLKEYVNTVGPVSVGICGTDPYFLYYGGGIFNTPDCCTELNHAVVIVGYGTDEDTGLDYWIAQNSWGERWGENGFIRLARSTSFFSLGQCGIAIGSSIPIGAHLLVPESEVLNPQPPNWEEWIDQLERWSLSNIQDIIYGFSALMVLISVSLFCCGLMIDIFTYVNGASPPAPPLLPSHLHPRVEQSNGAQVGGGPSVGSKYNSTSRSSALQAAPLPSSSSSSSYYQSENYQNNGV